MKISDWVIPGVAVAAAMFVALLLAGVAKADDVQSEYGVRVTRVATDVLSCEYVKNVHSIPPSARPGDAIRQLQAQAHWGHADTVLITGEGWVMVKGKAYRCGK